MARDILVYSAFGFTFAIVTMAIVGILRFGADAPKLLRPEKGDEWLTVVLLAAASAVWAVLLAVGRPF